MFYEMTEEPESTTLATTATPSHQPLIAIHTMPSDSEVIIGPDSDASGTRHKVVIPAAVSAKSFLRVPRCIRKSPVLGFGVIVAATTLLCAILLVIVFETWVSSSDLLEEEYDDFEDLHLDNVTYVEHTPEDAVYHRAMVKDINEHNAGWRAVYNKYASRSRTSGALSDPESQKSFMLKNIVYDRKFSTEKLVGDTLPQLRALADTDIVLPSSFDARQKWPMCESVHRVVNQGGCGSCYAISATSVIADRICIRSNGTQQPFISAQDLISCCPNCGGCHGTVWALFSFNHWRHHGIVTGGAYGSFEGCKPYAQAPNCGSPCSIDIYSSKHHAGMRCVRECQSLYAKGYQEDLHKAKSVYWVKVNNYTAQTVKVLQPVLHVTNVSSEVILKREIITNGPVLACFVVYEEFQHYRSGIYKSQTTSLSKDLYGHCAKLIGWGTEADGRSYWLYMNTWGRDWGEHGFFRMAEAPEEAAAGLPAL